MTTEEEQYEKIQNAIEALQEASSYEGCETGDFWNAISNLYESYSDYCSEPFKVAMEAEILHQKHRLDTEFEWDEREETETPRTRTVRELVYKG